MSKKKIMKPKEYKELVNKLTNRVLEQEGITWEEGSTKYGMTRTKPRFQKLDYGYVKDREYMVNFSLWEHTIKNKNIMEVREMIGLNNYKVKQKCIEFYKSLGLLEKINWNIRLLFGLDMERLDENMLDYIENNGGFEELYDWVEKREVK